MEPTENQGPYQPRTPPMAEDDPVVQWLLQGDPAIRWQVLRDLCHLGTPPDSPVMQETAHLVARNCRWEYDGRPFFAGEVDCCINAGTILIGAYLGVDVDPVVQRLVADQMPDGGWNCWAETRPAPASFASTLDVIDALLRWERHTGGSEEVRQARRNGEE